MTVPTFGYRAVAAVAEEVVHRIVRAEIASGRVPNTLRRTFSLPGPQGSPLDGELHARLSNAQLLFDPNHANRVDLRVDIHAILAFDGAPPLGLASEEWIRGTVAASVGFSLEGTALVADPRAASSVQLEQVTASAPLLVTMRPLIAAELASLLRSGAVDAVRVDLRFTTNAEIYDTVEARALAPRPLPAGTGGDQLVLGFLRSTNASPARSLQPFLGAGRSFAMRLAGSTFDEVVKAQLDDMFVRYDLILGDTEDEAHRRMKTVFAHRAAEFGRDYTARATDGIVDLAIEIGGGKPPFYVETDRPVELAAHHHPVRGLVEGTLIVPPKPGVEYRGQTMEKAFFSNTHGQFSLDLEKPWNFIPTGSTGDRPPPPNNPAPTSWLTRGDRVTLRGERKNIGGIALYYPTVRLRDGYIEISGTIGTGSPFGFIEIDYVVHVTYRIDPATGALDVDPQIVDYDLPAGVDFVIGVAKFFGSILFGPLIGIVTGEQRRSATEKATQTLEHELSAINQTLLAPALVPGRMITFLEGIEIDSDGIAIRGQLEAGWIRQSGRRAATRIELDREGALRQFLTIDPEQGVVRLESFRPPSLSTEGVAVVSTPASASGKSFEALTEEDLEKLAMTRNPPYVVVPRGDALAGTVLGVHTTFGRYAKVRVDRAVDGQWALRWITFEREQPTARIQGELRHDDDALVYWADFRVTARGLYTAYGLEVAWSWQGPGRFRPHSTDPSRMRFDFDFDRDQGTLDWFFKNTLRVTLTDIFGRSAEAEIEFGGPKGKLLESIPVPFQALETERLAGWLHGPSPVAQRLLQIALVAREAELRGVDATHLLDSGAVDSLLRPSADEAVSMDLEPTRTHGLTEAIP